MGTGAPAPPHHRTDASPIRSLGAARSGRRPAPRAAGRLRIPTRPGRGGDRASGPDPRSRRRVPGDARDATLPPSPLTAGRRGGVALRREGRAIRRGCRRGGTRGRRPSRCTPARRSRRAHPARGRGPQAARARAVQQTDRRTARDLTQDGGQPRRAHLHQDRRIHPRPREPVRDAARPAPRGGVRRLNSDRGRQRRSRLAFEPARPADTKMGRTPHAGPLGHA